MKIENLVLDTNALLSSVDGHFPDVIALWTLPELASLEIRDVNSRQRLETFLSTRIKFKSPTPSCIEWIKSFATKTGDIAILSLIDIRIMALTLTLYLEAMKDDVSKLRRVPLPPREHVPSHSKADPSTALTNNKENKLNSKNEQLTEKENNTDATLTEMLSSQLNIQENKLSSFPAEDEDNGWITPKNYKNHSSSPFMPKPFPSKIDSNILVGCMTSDFAMQNVLIQIGLSVIQSSILSSGPMLHITRIKHWVLRCHACLHLEWNPKRRFCDSCGNSTLIRTSYSINPASGQLVLYLKRDFQYNLRGTQYSIPQSKGGKSYKNGGDMIFREDQKEFARAMKGFSNFQKKMDRDPEDFVPFEGVKSSMRSSTLHPPTIGYGKRNPNQRR